jgi:uncharacterized protein with NRDE domain
MCLVVLALRASERYPLVLAANRDERHERPTLAAGWWPDQPRVLGGRDLVANGGWLGVDRGGRLAAVTNVRDGVGPGKRSRGELVADYLTGTDPIATQLQRVASRRAEYGPFNLLLLDGAELVYCSNRAPDARLERGIHALGNAPLGTDWPKVRTARLGMQEALAADDPTITLFELLAHREPALAPEDRYRAALFIDGPTYGTRSSTVILVSADRQLTFSERSFDTSGRLTGEVVERFRVESTRSDASGSARLRP